MENFLETPAWLLLATAFFSSSSLLDAVHNNYPHTMADRIRTIRVDKASAFSNHEQPEVCRACQVDWFFGACALEVMATWSIIWGNGLVIALAILLLNKLEGASLRETVSHLRKWLCEGDDYLMKRKRFSFVLSFFLSFFHFFFFFSSFRSMYILLPLSDIALKDKSFRDGLNMIICYNKGNLW